MEPTKKHDIHFNCHTCGELRIDSRKALIDHLKYVHGIDTETQCFEEQLALHLDAEDHYISVYEYSGGGVSFSSSEHHEREDDDPMRSYCTTNSTRKSCG